jgi:hypothetical protein
MRLEMEKLGHKMSINALFDELSRARQSIHVYQNLQTNKTKFVSAISGAPKAAEDYIAAYGLKKYLMI